MNFHRLGVIIAGHSEGVDVFAKSYGWSLYMSEEQFANYSTIILVGGLILFMAFIIYDLAKKSKAGKFGMMILFIGLFTGVLGFVIKTVLVEFMEVGMVLTMALPLC